MLKERLKLTILICLQRNRELSELLAPKVSFETFNIYSSVNFFNLGNNLHEVESPDSTEEKFLVSMPTKFRKNVWIKRGNFVLVETVDEGQKVKAEIVRVLTTEHQKEFSKHGVWPKSFTKKREIEEVNDNSDDDLCRNLNWRNHPKSDSESSSESD